MLWAVAVVKTERRWAVKSELAGSFDQRAKVAVGVSWALIAVRPSVV